VIRGDRAWEPTLEPAGNKARREEDGHEWRRERERDGDSGKPHSHSRGVRPGAASANALTDAGDEIHCRGGSTLDDGLTTARNVLRGVF
jgi:hypothetical protein